MPALVGTRDDDNAFIARQMKVVANRWKWPAKQFLGQCQVETRRLQTFCMQRQRAGCRNSGHGFLEGTEVVDLGDAKLNLPCRLLPA